MEPEGVESVGQLGTPTILLRAYHSSHHLWAAEHYSQIAGEIENTHSGPSRFDIRHRAYVTNCIMSSVAFLEAAINELYQDCYDVHLSYVAPLASNVRETIADFWGMTEKENKSPISVLDKYQLTLRFSDNEPFKKGESPYQDVDLLIKIRNSLVHFKPESLGGENVHKLENKLKGKFSENVLMAGSGNPFFPDKVLGSGCTEWATASVRAWAEEFFKRLGVVPNYQR